MYCSSVWAAAGGGSGARLGTRNKNPPRESSIFNRITFSRQKIFFFVEILAEKFCRVLVDQPVPVGDCFFVFFFVFSLLLQFEVKREKTSYLSYHRLKKRLTSILARFVWSKEGERGGGQEEGEERRGRRVGGKEEGTRGGGLEEGD